MSVDVPCDPLGVGGVIVVADLQQHGRGLGAFHLRKSGGGAGGHLIWQGIDLSQMADANSSAARRPFALPG